MACKYEINMALFRVLITAQFRKQEWTNYSLFFMTCLWKLLILLYFHHVHTNTVCLNLCIPLTG